MDLTPLSRAVHRALAQARAPLADGETISLPAPVSDYMTDAELNVLWAAVHALRAEHGKTFSRLTENVAASWIVQELLDTDATPSLSDVATALEHRLNDAGPWLVRTPLANVSIPRKVMKLADDVAVARTLATGADEERTSRDLVKLIGRRVPETSRWIDDVNKRQVDSRVYASLITVEDGIPAIALEQARARARYALATWPLLHPPGDHELLPDLGTWSPQPYFHTHQGHRGLGGGTLKGNDIEEWAPYAAPEEELLTLPFEAMTHIDRRSAQTLLSSALSCSQSSRSSRFLVSERVRYALSAIETLCESRPGASFDPNRWRAVTDRFHAWDALSALGYDPTHAAQIERRLRNARNISIHGADAVRLDLGFPADQERTLRGTVARGEDLAISSLQADLSPLIHVTRLVIAGLFEATSRDGWNDDAFAAHFQR